MLLSDASHFAGGVTRNVLHRARLLSERTGQVVTVLTLIHAPDFEDEIARLRESGLLGPLVEVRNFVREMDPTCGASHVPRAESASGTSRRDATDPAWIYLDGPALVMPTPEKTRQVARAAQGSSPTTVRKDYPDSSGASRRIEYFSQSAANRCQSVYLDANGRCFMELHYDDETKKSMGAFLYDVHGGLKSAYASLRDLQAEWASAIAAQHEKAVFFSDWRHSDAVLARMAYPGVAKIKTLHLNHLADPRTYGSELQPRTQIELGRLSQFDAFVALSHDQLADIARQFGPRATYHVISNPAPHGQLSAPVERNPFLVVGIGRYHVFKRWDRAITAFLRVVEQVPDARLELWGFGPEEQSLRELVERLGLSSHVSIKGITHDAQRVLAGAALSILSSPAEAFGLVALESMAVGTPMVAFDITYGMRDQITSGVNGILVPHPDTDALADAIVDLLNHPRKRDAMGHKALASSQRFGEREWIDRWLAVIAAACEQREHRRTIDAANASATLRRSRAGVIVGCRVHVEGPPNDEVMLALYAKSRSPFRDSYGRPASRRVARSVRVPGPVTADDLTLTSIIASEEIRAEKAVWDLYVSCSARNAHRFVRLSAAKGIKLDSWSAGGHDFKPHITENGNLSLRVATSKPPVSLGARAARWVRRRLQGSSRT